MNVRNAIITTIITAGLVSSSAHADDINTVIDASAIAGQSTSTYSGHQSNIQSQLDAVGYYKVSTSENVVAVPRTTIQSNLDAARNS